MLRYLRLYLYFLRFSLSKAMEFRLDFFFRIVMDVVFYIVHLAFFTVIYRHTDLLGGWTLDQIYLFVAGTMLTDALHMTLFANNLWWLPVYINRGDLDYYLVRPVSPLFLLSLREFAANSFVNLLIAAGAVVWAVWRYPEPLGAARVVLFLVLLGFGVMVYYLLRMLFIIPVFWLHSGRGLDEIAWSLNRLSEQPHQIYHPWLRVVMLTILPIALLVSVPSHALFGGDALLRLVHVVTVTACLFGFVVWFWRVGLRAYASASS
ncbi:MAG: ABC-2 family transporter protein [Acidobacteriota bacterium]